MVELGTAKKVITPEKALYLSGYADRKEPFKSVLEDIKLRVLAFKEDNTKATIVNADLIWWNQDAVDILLSRLANLKIDTSHIILTATHNHSGPGLGSTFIEPLERVDEEYRNRLIDITIDAIVEAENNYEEVVLLTAEGELSLNVYRRLLVNGKIEMKPNYSIPADNHLTLIRADRLDGRTKGLILHYPCHANLSKENAIQPDWPGSALNMIDSEHVGCTSIFLQGFTGDLRPNSVLGNSFIPCDRERVLFFASSFKQKVDILYNSATKSISTIEEVRKIEKNLPLNQKILEKAPTSNDEILWREKIKQKNERPYETLRVISFGLSDYKLILFNAEVVQSYAEYARKIYRKTLCSGYTNGMIGYLANEKQIEEGGYESVGSAVYFALAGTFDKSIEGIIKEQIGDILK